MNRFSVLKNRILIFLTVGMIGTLFMSNSMQVYAEPKSGAAATSEELEENAKEREHLPIQSNEVKGWPAGPEIRAESAILMDVDTGTILYAKNIHEELFPASTTKLMTCLVAYENAKLTDMVSFSHEAVFSVPRDGSSIGMDVGQSINMEQCLYGILVGSANEVANAVAEHVSGSIDEFVALMNERAKDIGCENTHFVNTNGLHVDDHYTSAYDLALIAKEYFANETLSRIANTPRYHFEPTETQPDDFYLKNKHALINGDIPYEGIKGGKTGYTDDARQTLVTCCERNGMRLICVVMMEESPNQFNDTVTLFDYGYSNFALVKASEYEKRYTINAESFFRTGSDIFGNSEPFLKMNESSRIILPTTMDFESLNTRVSYDAKDAVVQIFYSHGGVDLGSALVEPVVDSQPEYEFEHVTVNNADKNTGIALNEENKTIFINVKILAFALVGIAIVLILLISIVKITRDYHFSGQAEDRRRRRRNRSKRQRRKYHGEFSDYDF